MKLTGSEVTERVDARTEQDHTALPDQGSDLGSDFYWTEASR